MRRVGHWLHLRGLDESLSLVSDNEKALRTKQQAIDGLSMYPLVSLQELIWKPSTRTVLIFVIWFLCELFITGHEAQCWECSGCPRLHGEARPLSEGAFCPSQRSTEDQAPASEPLKWDAGAVVFHDVWRGGKSGGRCRWQRKTDWRRNRGILSKNVCIGGAEEDHRWGVLNDRVRRILGFQSFQWSLVGWCCC